MSNVESQPEVVLSILVEPEAGPLEEYEHHGQQISSKAERLYKYHSKIIIIRNNFVKIKRCCTSEENKCLHEQD